MSELVVNLARELRIPKDAQDVYRSLRGRRYDNNTLLDAAAELGNELGHKLLIYGGVAASYFAGFRCRPKSSNVDTVLTADDIRHLNDRHGKNLHYFGNEETFLYISNIPFLVTVDRISGLPTTIFTDNTVEEDRMMLPNPATIVATKLRRGYKKDLQDVLAMLTSGNPRLPNPGELMWRIHEIRRMGSQNYHYSDCLTGLPEIADQCTKKTARRDLNDILAAMYEARKQYCGIQTDKR